MNREECIKLVAYCQALAPHQQWGDLTALAWHNVLKDLPYTVAERAATEVTARQRWIGPSDILQMAAMLRRAVRPAAEHQADIEDDTPPAEVQAYLQWLHGRQRRIRTIADQHITAGRYDTSRLAIEGPDAA